ncbi:MAG: long-chain fatty acid--CoA ligase [Candidatus Omnitrophica bacterium]|nr:long-chain fatty acid--CoA ligase [Candidatus Omnitrophota bacterium]
MQGVSWLIKRFDDFSNDDALIWKDKAYSYRWLKEHVFYWKRLIKDKEVKKGDIVGFSSDYSPQACALLLALLDNANIAVPLPPVLRNEQKRFLEITGAQKLFVLNAKGGFELKKYRAKKIHPLINLLRKSKSPGVIIFTSGSTGEPKAILHNGNKLFKKYIVKKKKLCTIPFLFLDHIGGLNTLFYTLSSGGKLVMLQDRHPEAVCRAIAKHRVELLPVSPSFLNLLLISNAYKKYNLKSLKIISYGTEVMPEYTLERLNKLFPNTRLIQTYGLSELGIVSSKSKDSSSPWMRVGGDGFKTRIIKDELWVKSDFSMLGYLNAPNPFKRSGWLNTHDIVKHEDGYIKVLGRRSELINVGGQKVNPAEVESVILKLDDIKDVAVFGEKNQLLGNMVVARVQLKENTQKKQEEFKSKVRLFCREELPLFKIPTKLYFSDKDQFNYRFKKIRRNI